MVPDSECKPAGYKQGTAGDKQDAIINKHDVTKSQIRKYELG
jgi:hypothetical protein